MNNLKIVLLTLLIGIFTAGSALAAKTATLQVNANVIETCRFDSGGTLNFGDLDPLTGGDVSKSTTTDGTSPTFTCSSGTGYTISDDSASKPLANGTDTIDFSLAYTGSGTADGTSTALDISGTILSAAYANASAGTYNSTVTLTITP